jgi:hypothetical protein
MRALPAAVALLLLVGAAQVSLGGIARACGLWAQACSSSMAWWWLLPAAVMTPHQGTVPRRTERLSGVRCSKPPPVSAARPPPSSTHAYTHKNTHTQAFPQFWAQEYNGGNCNALPTRPFKCHQAPQPDSATSIRVTDAAGKAAASVCAGAAGRQRSCAHRTQRARRQRRPAGRPRNSSSGRAHTARSAPPCTCRVS